MIYLCLAHMSENGMEQKYVQEAFDTNWVVPMGPNVNAFEQNLADFANAMGDGSKLDPNFREVSRHLLCPAEDQRVVVPHQSGEIRPGADAFMGDDVVAVSRLPHFAAACEGGHMVEGVGQLGVLIFPAEQGVGHIAHIVGGDHADVTGGVTGGLNDAEVHPAEFKFAVL